MSLVNPWYTANRTVSTDERELDLGLRSPIGDSSGGSSARRDTGVSRSSSGRGDAKPERRFRYHETLAGKYQLEKSIARGGMGWVFLATQLPLGRTVAVKVLTCDGKQEAFRERFLLEASTCSKLQHPHIVTIFDYGQTDEGELFMAMEFLDGVSLARILAQNGPLRVERALRIILQVARALRAAHKAGVVHRDLKPANIMVLNHDKDTRDFVKVVDFGLAKLFESPGEGGAMELTRAGTMLGSPRYMAPEQIRNREIDPRTDIYSLGVVLYCVLTGRPPFGGDNASDILAQHLRDPVPALCSATGELEVPRELEAVVHRCMAKQPEARYPTIDHLISDLKAIYDGYLEGSLPSDTLNSAALAADLFTPAPYSGPTPPPLPPVSGDLPSDTASRSAHLDEDFGQEPKGKAAIVWAAVLVAGLILGLVMLWPKPSPTIDSTRAAAPPAAPAAPSTVTLRTVPSGLMLLDDAGAELGTTPLKISAPTPEHPLRVRASKDGRVSNLLRVLPEPGANEITVDLQAWVDTEPAPEASEPVVNEASGVRRTAQRETRRRPRRPGATPDTDPATPRPAPHDEPALTAEPSPAPATPSIPVAKDEPVPAPAEPTRPSIGVIEDSKPKVHVIDQEGPSVGLVDEAETPNVGIIEE